MSQFNIGSKAFTAGEAMEAYRRVKLSTGSGTQVEYADAGDAFIGFTAAAVNLGEMVSVILKNTGMTFKVTANGVIAVGGSFYGALDGKVSATVSGSIQGRVLEAAAADGEIVEAILL
jgi:hypothetical protein